MGEGVAEEAAVERQHSDSAHCGGESASGAGIQEGRGMLRQVCTRRMVQRVRGWGWENRLQRLAVRVEGEVAVERSERCTGGKELDQSEPAAEVGSVAG